MHHIFAKREVRWPFAWSILPKICQSTWSLCCQNFWINQFLLSINSIVINFWNIRMHVNIFNCYGLKVVLLDTLQTFLAEKRCFWKKTQAWIMQWFSYMVFWYLLFTLLRFKLPESRKKGSICCLSGKHDWKYSIFFLFGFKPRITF